MHVFSATAVARHASDGRMSPLRELAIHHQLVNSTPLSLSLSLQIPLAEPTRATGRLTDWLSEQTEDGKRREGESEEEEEAAALAAVEAAARGTTTIRADNKGA